MKRSEIVTYVRSWAGVKWTHQGRTETGIDCAGLVVKTAAHFAVPHKDLLGYSRFATGEKFVDVFKAYLPIAELPLRPGMVVILRDDILPCHAGILGQNAAGELTLIHSSVRQRKVAEENWTAAWKSRFRLALDFPGVEED